MHDIVEKGTASQEWKDGWLFIIPATFGTGLISVIIYSMGIFIGPIEAEFGWSRALTTAGVTITSIVLALLSPAVGLLIDRFGPRRVAIPGLAFYCATIALLATATQSPFYWILLWVVAGVAAAFIAPMVWTAAVASRFTVSRGMALATCLCGPSLAAIYAPLITSHLQAGFGWRLAYLGLAAFLAVVMIPLTTLFFFSNRELGPGRQKPAEPPRDVKACLLSADFIKIAAASCLIMTSVTSILVHFVPMLTIAGIDRVTAASIAGIIGMAGIGGRLTAGFLLDRVNASLIGGVAFFLPVLACVCLMGAGDSILLAGVAAALIGFAVGAELDVAAYLTSRIFGIATFGTLFGVVVGLMNLGIAVGPLLASLVFDSFGNYDLAVLGVALGSLASSILIFSTRRRAAGLNPDSWDRSGPVDA